MHYHSVSITSVRTLPMAVLNGLHVFEKNLSFDYGEREKL